MRNCGLRIADCGLGAGAHAQVPARGDLVRDGRGEGLTQRRKGAKGTGARGGTGRQPQIRNPKSQIRNRRQSAIPSAGRARGAVLLEIILAMTLFAGMVGVVLGAFDASLGAVRRCRLEAKAGDLAATVAAYVESGELPPSDAGPRSFAEPPFEMILGEEWTWQIVTEDVPATLPGMNVRLVRILVVNEPEGVWHTLAMLVGAGAEAEEGGGGDWGVSIFDSRLREGGEFDFRFSIFNFQLGETGSRCGIRNVDGGAV